MTDKNKLYSLHEESVECIAKGKAHKRYEFGCKVSLSITHKGKGVVTSSHAVHGNPFDHKKRLLQFGRLCRIY